MPPSCVGALPIPLTKNGLTSERKSLINPDDLTNSTSQVADLDYSLLAISGKRLTQTLKMGMENMACRFNFPTWLRKISAT